MLKAGHITRDITQMAREKVIESAIGMEKKYFAALQVLMRKNRKNVLIVGERGVGKTKLVHGLAVSGLKSDPLSKMLKYSILELDLSATSSNSRNVIETVHSILGFLRKSPNVILFIDGMMRLLEGLADENSSSGTASVLLPPILKAEISCIGTLTKQEYIEIVERYPNISRDFEVIRLEPTSDQETLTILAGLRPRLEKHYEVKISDSALNAAITLSQRFIPERNHPGNAIETLDQACARYRLKVMAKDTYLELLDDQSIQNMGTEVDHYDIMKVVGEVAGIDIHDKLLERQTKIAERLRRHVIAQDEAIELVASAITGIRMGFNSPYKPAGVFLFYGPPGVGKRHVAQTLTRSLFGSTQNLLMLDVNEFADANGPERLVGPAGLAVAAGKSPLCVVVLTHIQRATPAVMQVLLPIFKTGLHQRSETHVLNFRHCLFIVGFDTVGQADSGIPDLATIKEAIASRIPDQDFGCFSLVATFKPLRVEAVRAMVRHRLHRFCRSAEGHPKEINLSKEASDFVIAEGFSLPRGAKDLERTVDELVLAPVQALLKEGKLAAGTIVQGERADQELEFKTAGK